MYLTFSSYMKLEERNKNSTRSACDCCSYCVKLEDVKPVCKEEVDNAPITCILSVKSEPHTEIEHPLTSGDNREAWHRTTSNIAASVQSGVCMLGSVHGAGDMKEVSCCIRQITNMM
jgi:hypothetical protein